MSKISGQGQFTAAHGHIKLWLTAILAVFILGAISPLAAAFEADLKVDALQVDDNSPDEGQIVELLVRAKNNNSDPGTVSGIYIDVPVPAGLTFVDTVPGGASYDSGTGRWTVGSLDDGDTITLVIRAQVDFGTGGQTLTVDANISSTDPSYVEQPGKEGDNSRSVAMTVRTADLRVTKTVNNLIPDEGETITFTIKVKNLGPANATNATVRDFITSTLAFVSATANQGTYDEVTGVWTVGALANGVERTLTIDAIVTAGTGGTAITNNSIVLSIDQTDGDLTNDAESVEMIVATPDLEVIKTVNDSSPGEGQSIEYTVQIENLGPAQATGVEVTDLLPAGVTFSSIDTIEQGTYDDVSGLWDIGTLDNGATVKLVLVVVVDAGTAAQTITNTARVTNLVQADGDLSNNAGSIDIFVNGADLAVTKTVDNVVPLEGGTITYTIRIDNNGPLKANDITLTDLLPTGVTYVSSTISQGAAYIPVTGVWFANDINAGAFATMTITATVDPGTLGSAIVNTASITGVVEADSVTGNNSDSALIVIGNADVAVSKSVNAGPFDEGDPVSYTVGITNTGPDTAAGFLVADLLPAGITYVSHSIVPATGAGSYDPVSGVWSYGIDTLATGASATLTINATVDSGTAARTITNTATVVAAQSGNNPANDVASAAFQVAGADLAITKVVDDDRPQTGETFTYTLTLTNNGPDAATGVVVTDFLPTGVGYLADVPSQGTYDETTGLWTVGGLAVGVSATLDIDVTMTNARTAENKASITASDQLDSVIDNNEARVTVAGSGSYGAGACILDLGADADNDGVQEIEEGMTPYGFVYFLMTDHKIPVDWIIDPDKTTADGVDVTIDGVDYTHGPFVIRPEYIDAVIDDPLSGDTVRDKLASWAIDNPGFTYACDLPAFTAPVFDQITFWPRSLLDTDNGSIAADYYTNAGLPQDGSYASIGRPRDLGQCNDIYVMPHADPHDRWLDGESGQLADGSTATVYDTIKFLKFVEQGGQMWAACHAVSATERLLDVPPQSVWDSAGETPPSVVTPGQTPTGLFMLSDAGLVDWGDHSDGSGAPYSYDPAVAAEPIMQFLGDLSTATENGSEQIYLPDDDTASSNWRETTTVAVYDPDQQDLFSNGGELSEGLAAKVAYGRAYGQPDYGWIMYEGGHSQGNGEEVPAQRAFLNFHFLTGILRRPQIQGSLNNPVITRDETNPQVLTVTVSGGSNNYTFEWSNTCGGTFSPTDTATTTYTPPPGQENIAVTESCIIRVAVLDTCARANFAPLLQEVLALDFGDAPNSYDGEGVAVDTAYHTIRSDGPYLGAIAPDVEDAAGNGLPPWAQDDSKGDDDDLAVSDEDGVALGFNPASDIVTAVVTASNPNAQDARLCGWVDGGNTLPVNINGLFDRDGTDVPGDEEECVTVPAGTMGQDYTLTWNWTGTITVNTFARFRITTDPAFFSSSSPSPTGPAIDGEIEDHTIRIRPTAVVIDDIDLEVVTVAAMLAELTGAQGDADVLAQLLARFDSALAETLADASATELAAALAEFLDPDGDGHVVVVHWFTLEERGTIGFFVERQDDSGQWQTINDDMLPGLLMAPMGGEYMLADPEARPGQTYRYRLIEQEANGNTRNYGPYVLQVP